MANYGNNLMQQAAMRNGGKVDLPGKNAVPEALFWARKAVVAGNELRNEKEGAAIRDE